jgi:hypothetical protein
VSVRAIADIGLRDGPTVAKTVLTWSIDVTVSGPLASVGRRLVDRVADPLIAQTLRCMNAQLTETSNGRSADVALTRDQVRRFDPQWCVFCGRSGDTAQLETWIPYLERSRSRFAILTPDDIGEEIRERIADAPNIRIIEPYVQGLEWLVASRGFRGYLYVGSSDENFLTINRHPDAAHVFIGHGESGMPGCEFRTGSLYDAIFVADYAAVRRFPRAIRPWVWRRAMATGAVIVDGVAKDARVHPRKIKTILYAPTWEGIEGDDCASVDVVAPILGRLVPELAGQGIEVLLPVHPDPGGGPPGLREALTPLLGAGVVTGRSKAEAFDRADVLISDIAGVAAEFLFTEKPSIMPIVPDLAAIGVDARWLDREYPWVYRWDTTADGLHALLREIETRDPLRGRRASEARRKFRHHRSIDDAAQTFDLALSTLTWGVRPIPLRFPFEVKMLGSRLDARSAVRP